MITDHQITAAVTRIRPYVRETLLERSVPLSELGGAAVWLKCEHLQHTGSFKVRGATNKILSLSVPDRARGVVTASSGNHGRAVAHALTIVRGRGTVYLPTTVPTSKVEALRRYASVELEFYGADGGETEVYARSVADATGRVYISPYNDPAVVVGQGTIGVELLAQCQDIEVVLAAVGGGGLLAGIATYVKAVKPSVQIIGCLPENSPVMSASAAAGRILDVPTLPTLSDGTAGGMEPGAITFDLCRSLIDGYVLVSEAEIADSIRFILRHHHWAVEGAAAVAVAAYRKTAERFAGKTVAIILCGANIGYDTLRQVICDGGV